MLQHGASRNEALSAEANLKQWGHEFREYLGGMIKELSAAGYTVIPRALDASPGPEVITALMDKVSDFLLDIFRHSTFIAYAAEPSCC